MIVLEALLVGLLTTLFAWYLSFNWKRRRMYFLADKFDGPCVPLVGSALDFFGKSHEGIFESFQKLIKSHCSNFRIWLGPFCMVFVVKPQDLQTVMNSPHCLNKSQFYEIIPNKTGLVTSKGKNVKKNNFKILNVIIRTILIDS